MIRKGFFASLPTVKAPPPLVPRCDSCGLYKGCRSPKMAVTGEGRRKILVVGEAPGCVAGGTLIETAFRDKSICPDGVPIRDLVGKTGFWVYCFDTKKAELALGRVRRVWKTKTAPVYRVTYEWHDVTTSGKRRINRESLLVTSDHMFLLKEHRRHDPLCGKNRAQKSGYLSIDGGLRVGDSLQPFYRRHQKYQRVGIRSSSTCLEGRFLLGSKIGRKLTAEEDCHHNDENKWNDSWDNLVLMSKSEHTTHHLQKSNPMSDPVHRLAHKRALADDGYRKGQSEKLSQFLQDPTNYQARVRQIRSQASRTSATVKKLHNDPSYYYRYLLGRMRLFKKDLEWVLNKFSTKFPGVQPPSTDNHVIVSITLEGEQDVYDMEVEKFHNFSANGVFVHNSTEERLGKPFVGLSGQYLQEVCGHSGVSLFRDCWVVNSLSCHPPGDKIDNKTKIDHCRPLVLRAVRQFKPEVVILLGASAVQSVIGHLWKEDDSKGGIGRWLGWQIPSQEWNCWVCPTYHPAFVTRNLDRGGNPVVVSQFRDHLSAALSLEGRPWKNVPDFKSKVRLILDHREAAQELLNVYSQLQPIAFDYETNMLKPDSEDAEIVCCSVSNGSHYNLAFPWYGEAVEVMREMLASPRIKKIGWNLKFESRWSAKKLGVVPRGWVWDGMLAAHALDSRRGITSLKFQSFVRLGMPDYDSHVKPHLKAEGGNTRNRIRELPIEDVLRYCSLDSLLEFKVAKLQAKELGVTL